MKRRGFLRLLALLPFAPKIAEAAAQTINKPVYTGFDTALSGSDQTAIWLVEWGKNMGPPPTLLDVANKYHYNSLPIVEVLSQKNHLLQDMVWKEGNMTSGHRVSWDTKWAHEQIDLWGNK